MDRNAPDEEKSRSQLKREYRELKDLGIRLVSLSPGQLRAIPISAETREAALAAKPLKRTALQRQYRYLNSLLAREENIEAIRAALEGAFRPHALEVAATHRVEQMRDRLLAAEDPEVVTLVDDFPEHERSRLLELVRQARRERELGKPPKSARLLFRHLRELLTEQT